MGFIFDPARKIQAQQRLQGIMSATKCELQHALPFAMEPVVYDFAINEHGSFADLLSGSIALMPAGYYTLTVPDLLRQDRRALSPLRRAELDKFGAACRAKPELSGMVQTLFDALLPRGNAEGDGHQSLSTLLAANGLDPKQHEQIRTSLREGRIGLAQNRLPTNAVIEDVCENDVTDLTQPGAEFKALDALGLEALRNGEVAVITLAAGAGSAGRRRRRRQALHPFAKLAGRHRTFLRRTSPNRAASHAVPGCRCRTSSPQLSHTNRRLPFRATTTTATKDQCLSPGRASVCG
jgi:hypothetical protein